MNPLKVPAAGVFCLLLLLVLAAAGSAAGTSGRVRERLDAGWRFRRDPGAAPAAAGAVPAWSWRTATGVTLDLERLPAGLETGDWTLAAPGEDIFRGRRGFAWFRGELRGEGKGAARLHFQGVDDNAVVFLNGVRLGRHEGWDEPFDLPVGSAWKAGGPNVLTVLVENTDGRGGISGAVTLEGPGEEGIPEAARPELDDSGWRTVHLPHDYVVEERFDPRADTSHGSLPVVPAWYRKRFTLPASWRGRSVWIDFDGVYRNSTVFLNGRRLGDHPGGYTSFRYDISRAAEYGGPNVLAVRVDPRQPEGWWYEGGGIYRHVWLNAADPVHVAPWGTFVMPVVKGIEGAEHPPADVPIRTTVVNDTGQPETCLLTSRVVSPLGQTVATVKTTESIPAGGIHEFRQTAALKAAELWSLESPWLYRLETSLSRDGREVDRTETSFGVRSIRFDPDKGFFLNGKPVKLKGTCNHQDHAGVGIALPDGLIEWRIRKLQEMGSNAYRCSHNPTAVELLDACDRLGMLVMDENRHLGDTFRPKTPRGTAADDLSELKGMVLRDRNHPCIIMWSMFNEEGLQGAAEGARIFSRMKDLVRTLDPSRPVTGAMNGGWGKGGVSEVTDLQGFNYGIGQYAPFHAGFPGLPVYGSETASTVSTRGIYENDPARGYVSAYDLNRPGWGATAEAGWKPIAEHPYMAAAFVWTGFDYKGEPTPYGWPCINSHFGIMDICGFPKDNFYYYQAWWGDKPLVHLLPHWSWKGKEGQPISVWCHGNTDRVELSLNGKSLGSKEMPRYGHLEWKVDYAPGVLLARGFKGDRLVATDRVETTGPPVGIRLKADRTHLTADGEDVTVVEVRIVDERGRVVPEADNLVRFSVEGAGHVGGVGNGDPSSHEPDKASERHAFNGLCMVLVGADEAPGGIVLRASSPGLQEASLKLRSTEGGR